MLSARLRTDASGVEEELTHLLGRYGLFSTEAVVDGTLCADDLSRRHDNYAVHAGPGTSVLLKRASDPSLRAAIEAEATVYRTLHEAAPFEEVRSHVPRVVRHDLAAGVLILELIAQAQSARQSQWAAGRASETFASHIGRFLGALHRPPPEALEARHRVALPRLAAPWILSVDCPHVTFFERLSLGSLELIRVLRGSDTLIRDLRGIEADWVGASLIHNDCKWDNCLVPTSESGHDGLWVVDWELAGFGDPAWDAGSVLADYLTAWIFSGARTVGSSSAGDGPEPGFSLDESTDSVRCFWSQYTDARALPPRVARAELERAMRFGAARLVQGALEHTQNHAELTGPSVQMLQLAENILRRPDRAAEDLVGLA